MAEAAGTSRLVVLGAGVYQRPCLEAARALGIATLAVDWSADAPAAAAAARFAPIDTTDVASVLAAARDFCADGILSPCTDVAVSTQAEVAAALGLPGPSPDAAAILTDKGRFRAWQQAQGDRHPTHLVTTLNDIRTLSLPGGTYVIKPARSSGSKGVFLCTAEDLATRAVETADYCPDGRMVVERAIEGRHGTVEGVWRDGTIALAMITDRMTAAPPLVATTGHRYPSRFAEGTRRRVLDAAAAILGRLAIPDTVFDGDFIADAEDVAILELTPRLGGNSLSRLMLAACGVDMPGEAIRCALRPALRDRLAAAPRRAAAAAACAVSILGVQTDGVLGFDAAEEARLRREPWLAALDWDMPPGSPVRGFRNGRDRIGEALILAAGRDGLDARCAELARRLALAS